MQPEGEVSKGVSLDKTYAARRKSDQRWREKRADLEERLRRKREVVAADPNLPPVGYASKITVTAQDSTGGAPITQYYDMNGKPIYGDSNSTDWAILPNATITCARCADWDRNVMRRKEAEAPYCLSCNSTTIRPRGPGEEYDEFIHNHGCPWAALLFDLQVFKDQANRRVSSLERINAELLEELRLARGESLKVRRVAVMIPVERPSDAAPGPDSFIEEAIKSLAPDQDPSGEKYPF